MQKWLPYILVVLLTLSLTACGKKGPPVPPDDDGKQQESPAPANSEERRGTPYRPASVTLGGESSQINLKL
jgi:predicted small lipoprotein YifL